MTALMGITRGLIRCAGGCLRTPLPTTTTGDRTEAEMPKKKAPDKRTPTFDAKKLAQFLGIPDSDPGTIAMHSNRVAEGRSRAPFSDKDLPHCLGTEAQRAFYKAMNLACIGAREAAGVAPAKKEDCEALRRALNSLYSKLAKCRGVQALSEATYSALWDALESALNELDVEEDTLSRSAGGRPKKDLAHDLARRLAVVLIDHNQLPPTNSGSVTHDALRLRAVLSHALKVHMPANNLGHDTLRKIALAALKPSRVQKGGEK